MLYSSERVAIFRYFMALFFVLFWKVWDIQTCYFGCHSAVMLLQGLAPAASSGSMMTSPPVGNPIALSSTLVVQPYAMIGKETRDAQESMKNIARGSLRRGYADIVVNRPQPLPIIGILVRRRRDVLYLFSG